jgi:putative ABC transport system permease protein
MRLALTLSLRDLGHDWRVTFCFLAALMGVLAPLLVLFALKNGIIQNMVTSLVDDPSNRELIAEGAARYPAEFFETLQQNPDVGFISASTRSINTTVSALRHRDARALERNVSVIPTGEGDPLIKGNVPQAGEVYLSDSLAEALSAEPGDTLEMFVDRELSGQRETARREMAVAGIVSKQLYGRDAAFLSLPDLLAVELYRDDRAITAETWTEPRPEPAYYPSFRLYARDLDVLPKLRSELAAMGVRARPRAQNVELLLALRTNLNILFLAVAGLACAGFWFAMAANLRAMTETRRVTFSLLGLLGSPLSQRRMIPLMQAIILVQGGIALTLLVVLPAIAGINAYFSDAGGNAVAQLGWVHIVATLAIGLVTSLTASGWALSAVGGIGMDEVLTHAA